MFFLFFEELEIFNFYKFEIIEMEKVIVGIWDFVFFGFLSVLFLFIV